MDLNNLHENGDAIKTFSGNKNLYTIVGTRDNARLGIHVEVQVHPNTGHPFLVVRFAAVSIDGEKFDVQHFAVRDQAPFLYGPDTRPGFRLNRVVIPTFDSTMPKSLFLSYGDKFEIWGKIADWILEQVVEGGYMPTGLKIADLIRGMFTPPPMDPSVQSILKLPSLTEPDMMAAPPSPAPPASSDEDESDDADEDEDEDEDEGEVA